MFVFCGFMNRDEAMARMSNDSEHDQGPGIEVGCENRLKS